MWLGMIKHNLETLQAEVHMIFLCCEVLLLFLIPFPTGHEAFSTSVMLLE